MIKIIAINALKDNYIWLICDTAMKYAAVVDPGEAAPVIEFLNVNKIALTEILVTHHHADHTAGIPELLAYNDVPVYNAKNVVEGDEIFLPHQQASFNTIAIPGHTLDHLAFYGEDTLFSGDTLFSAGCGKIFEGTPAQMWNSLQKIKRLPVNTNIYCGHEYTVNNLRFATEVEPNNQDIKQSLRAALLLREQFMPTLPSILREELKINPFLRSDNPDVAASVMQHCDKPLTNEIEVFAELRAWKNSF